MTAERANDRDWLTRGAARNPDGWEAIYVRELGQEGALDLLALQAGRVWEPKLSRRPFAGNPDLKARVLEAREALGDLQREAYVIGTDLVNDARQAREARDTAAYEARLEAAQEGDPA